MNVKALHTLYIYTVFLILKKHIKLFPSGTFDCNEEIGFQ